MKFKSDNKTYLAKHLSDLFFKSRVRCKGPLMEILKGRDSPIVSVIRYLNRNGCINGNVEGQG